MAHTVVVDNFLGRLLLSSTKAVRYGVWVSMKPVYSYISASARDSGIFSTSVIRDYNADSSILHLMHSTPT